MSEYVPTAQDLAELDEFYREQDERWWAQEFAEFIDLMAYLSSLVD